ncbi:MAG: hypothetical protein M1825_004167 [Sarcosagium campestre]|nr:MAG: hypothetical protein M1825_004167 [Sarcosagium campestre]
MPFPKSEDDMDYIIDPQMDNYLADLDSDVSMRDDSSSDDTITPDQQRVPSPAQDSQVPVESLDRAPTPSIKHERRAAPSPASSSSLSELDSELMGFNGYELEFHGKQLDPAPAASRASSSSLSELDSELMGFNGYELDFHGKQPDPAPAAPRASSSSLSELGSEMMRADDFEVELDPGPAGPPASKGHEAGTARSRRSSSSSDSSGGRQCVELGRTPSPPVIWNQAGSHFSPEELVRYGALSLSAEILSEPPNLDIVISRLIDRANWLRLLPSDWPYLIPSLRIVSHILRAEFMWPFFHTLFRGQRELEPLSTSKYGLAVCRIVNTQAPISHQEAYNAYRMVLALNGKISMEFSNTDGCSWATTRRMNTIRTDEGGHGSEIRISHRLLIALRPGRARSLEQKMRCEFFLANILVHELSHAFHNASRFTSHLSPDLNIPEPFIENDREAELGHALEMHLWGGNIDPYVVDPDCGYGLMISRWPDARNGFIINRPPGPFMTFYLVPMEFVHDVQTKRFWRDVSVYGGVKCKIPKVNGYRTWNELWQGTYPTMSCQSSDKRPSSPGGRVGGRA